MANTIVCSWHIRPWTARSLRETHRPQLKRRIRSRSSPAAGATIVTDTRAEAYLEQMIILLRAWINATVTGPDPRTSRAAEHNCPSLSFTRGRTATLERDLMQIHSFLLDQETCWALLEWFTLLEQTRVHWQDQNQLWWDLFQLANDVEDWLRTRQGPELRQA